MTAQDERAAVVTWLRAEQAEWSAKVARYRANGNHGPYLGEPNYAGAANAIERGEHLTGGE